MELGFRQIRVVLFQTKQNTGKRVKEKNKVRKSNKESEELKRTRK